MQISPVGAETEALAGPVNETADGEERAAPRFTLLIRPAKLRVGSFQIVCVIRDISTTGISVRLFQDVAWRGLVQIELQTGDRYSLEHVWHRGAEAGFQFLDPVSIDRVIAQSSLFPKRDLRFDIDLPARLRMGCGTVEAQLENVSRQGGLLRCDVPLALGQPLRIESDRLPDIEARVRWRSDGIYGLVFDTTFSFAALAAAVRATQRDPAPADSPIPIVITPQTR